MDKYPRKVVYRKRMPQKSFDGSKLKKILTGIFLLFVMIWAVLGIVRSDLFTLKHLVLEGNDHTQEAEIRQALQVAEGSNILQLNLALLENRLLTIPRIESVDIRRQLPQTLFIAVRERKVLALVPFQEYFLEVGTNGQIVGTTLDSHTYDVPLLTGIVPVAGTVGDKVVTDLLLRRVEELCLALENRKMMVSEINVASEDNLVLVMMNGLIVWIGSKDFDEKTRILEQIMGQLSGRQGQGYLDLRVPTAPAFHIIEPKNMKNN